MSQVSPHINGVGGLCDVAEIILDAKDVGLDRVLNQNALKYVR
ncbi:MULTISPECIES: hypothetical protein [Pacificibacter]|nr:MULTISPECIES: hypothetical protein [Pacificibacter]MDO6616236.1 hypothetical protein [Pacificibacter sp. 1_MG-2023]